MSLPSGVRPTPVGDTSVLKWMEEHAIYDSETGAEVRFFGVFEPPDLTGASDTETVVRIDDVRVCLDTLADRWYGDHTLDWFLALYNGLDVPDAYLYRGMLLRYPSKEWVSTNVKRRAREGSRRTW